MLGSPSGRGLRSHDDRLLDIQSKKVCTLDADITVINGVELRYDCFEPWIRFINRNDSSKLKKRLLADGLGKQSREFAKRFEPSLF